MNALPKKKKGGEKKHTQFVDNLLHINKYQFERKSTKLSDQIWCVSKISRCSLITRSKSFMFTDTTNNQNKNLETKKNLWN